MMNRKLLLLLFCISFGMLNAQNSSDTCVGTNDEAAITGPGSFNVEAINGSDIPTPVCASNGTNNVTAGEWFRYIPAENTFVTVTTDLGPNAGGDTRLHIYTGDCGNLTCVAGDDDGGVIGNGFLSIAAFDAIANQTYYIAFDNRWNSSGFDFELYEGDAPPPPEPDAVTFTIQDIETNGSDLAVVDMNGDFLDDIVSVQANNINIHYQLGSGGFTEVNIETSTADFTPSWSLAAADYDGNGFTDLLYGNGSGVTFMKANDFGSGFTEISGPEYVFSQRSNFADINNDGHLDAFVCHDVQPNVYYINDGNGNLSFVQGGLGDYSSGGNYGSVWIDYDNDRDLDMFIAKCGGEEARRTNQMHNNNGDGTFTENAGAIGLADAMQTWSSAWGDFDNDGDMDVFVGASSGAHKLMQNNNGVFEDVTADSGLSTFNPTGIENVPHDFDNDGNMDVASNGNILLGNGDMTFSIAYGVLPGGGCFGDLNNDGFIDVFQGSIRMNDGNDNNWIKINTVGTDSNINGIGARVELHIGDNIQIRDVRSGEGFRYMSSLNTHFGVGTETEIDTITIYWPSGIIDVIENPEINTTISVVEGSFLSIEDESIENLIIYPNPVSDVLNINTSSALTNRIATVFDLNGRRVLNEKLIENTLNVSKLQSGIYFLRLESNGKSLKRKFIKE